MIGWCMEAHLAHFRQIRIVDSRSTILESDCEVVIDTALVLIVVPLAQGSFRSRISKSPLVS